VCSRFILARSHCSTRCVLPLHIISPRCERYSPRMQTEWQHPTHTHHANQLNQALPASWPVQRPHGLHHMASTTWPPPHGLHHMASTTWPPRQHRRQSAATRVWGSIRSAGIFAEGTAYITTKWDVHRAGLARYRQSVVGGWRLGWSCECIRASGARWPTPQPRRRAALPPSKGHQQNASPPALERPVSGIITP
jgi:hypothetical protein